MALKLDNAQMLQRLFRHTKQVGECVVWTANRLPTGYGRIRIRPVFGKKNLATHRLSYELQVGPIPPGMCVLHRCDNPPCINAAHLFLGTQLENVRDRVAKKRSANVAGERNGRAKLTAEQVQEIRARYAPRDRRNGARPLAREFGLAHQTVRAILSSKTWRQ